MTLWTLVRRNASRKPLRTLLTIGGLTLPIGLLTFLEAAITNLETEAANSDRYDRVVAMHNQSLTRSLPVSHYDRLGSIEGVTQATFLTWFGGLYGDEKAPFAQFGCDPETTFEVFSELRIPPEQLEAWKSDRGGAILGRKGAEQRGLEVGDRMRIKGVIYPFDLDLTIRGIFDVDDPLLDATRMFFHNAYIDEMPAAQGEPYWRGRIGTIWMKAASTSLIPSIMEQADAITANTADPTRSQTEQAFGLMFANMLGNYRFFVRSLGFAITFLLVLVAANTMAMAYRERVTELAVCKALGFSSRLLALITFGESLVLTAVSALLGVGLGNLVLGLLDDFGLAFLANYSVPPRVYAITAGIALVVAIGAAAPPAWSAMRLSVVNGLRKVV